MSGFDDTARGSEFDVHDLKPWATCLAGMKVEMLLALATAPRHVGDMCELLQLDYSAVSHSLHDLRLLRLVAGEQDGRHKLYRLSPRVRVERETDEVWVKVSVPRARSLVLRLPGGARRGIVT